MIAFAPAKGTGCAGRVVRIMKKQKRELCQVIGMSFLLLFAAAGTTGCLRLTVNTSSENTASLDGTEGIKTEKVPDTDNALDAQRSDVDEPVSTDTEAQTSADNSYPFVVGSVNMVLNLPEGAEDVYANDFSIIYTYKGVTIEYRDTFHEVTQDDSAMLQEEYEKAAYNKDFLSPSDCIEPTATQVGSRNAYYFRVVEAYSDGDWVDYTFFVDIGAENYLEVGVYGMSSKFTEQDAFAIADLGI